MVKELRERTGGGVKECKDVLTQTGGNVTEAIELLRQKGLRVTEKVKDRVAREGRIEAYIHPGSKMVAIVELNCETDFVAHTDDFMALARDIALQVAATNPRYIRAEEVPAEEITASELSSEKYYEDFVLLAQPFVKDGSLTIEEKIKNTVAKVRENIVVRRFVRYEIGGE